MSTTLPSTIETQPHPTFHVYSAGNFAEVAPARLSPMSWSLVGDPVERVSRRIVERFWPGAKWHTGSHYTFVGYFRCRPYHNLSAYCQLANDLPGLDSEDVTSNYFEDAPAPPLARGLRASLRSRAMSLPRMIRELAVARERLTDVEGELVALEGDVRAALATGSLTAVGAAFARAREVLDEAWEIHYTTTIGLVPLRVIQRRLGRRLIDHWDDVEPWLNRPQELVWTLLRDAQGRDGPLGRSEFVDRAFYEIADDREPWSRYAARPRLSTSELSNRARAYEPGEVVWEMYPGARLAGMRQVARAVSDTMACRESTKSLAMRGMHVFRRLVPAMAEAAGIAEADWPYLTVDELTGAHVERELAARAVERRRECEAALEQPAPELIDSSVGAERVLTRRPEEARRCGRGVSPGLVTGEVVEASFAHGNGNGSSPRRPRILVCQSADADVQPVLPLVDGVVTARGSVLSHIAILVRELGIPAVVGHPIAQRLRPGQIVSLDGTEGEVTVVDDGSPI